MRGKYIIDKIYIKLFGIEKFLKKEGCIIGDNCHIYSTLDTQELYLIKIGSDVTISNRVQFITHDNSVCKVDPTKTDIIGKIEIGNNCFIGARSIIMHGVVLPNNTIVAAGSVVTKSLKEEGCVLGGNPAKIIGYLKNYDTSCAVNLEGVTKKNKIQLIKNSAIYKRGYFHVEK